MQSLIPARFGLRAKLLTGAAVLLAFTAVIGVLGIRSLDQANASSSRMYDVSVKPLAELGTEYRTILVLREIDGCRYDEIAEILDLPVGTVRSRLFRARLQLRDHLAPRFHVERIVDTR